MVIPTKNLEINLINYIIEIIKKKKKGFSILMIFLFFVFLFVSLKQLLKLTYLNFKWKQNFITFKLLNYFKQNEIKINWNKEKNNIKLKKCVKLKM